MTGIGKPPVRSWSAEVLTYPAGTTLRIALLVAVVLTAGVFVGDWLYLATITGTPAMTAPLVWLGVPPLISLLVLLVLAAVTPVLFERRLAVTEVPDRIGLAARARLAELSGAAGLTRPPRLMWNQSAKGARARAYGLPGRYRILVDPAVIGSARRKPQVFDAILRHELAHIRNHDILPAAAARVAGLVVIGTLAVPLLWRLVDRDLSLLPGFLVRAALLVVATYLVRAAVLRAREHYADVRAACWSGRPRQDAERFTVVVNSGEPRPAWRTARSWFALHPDPGRRAEVVRSPNLLARPGAGEMFTIGLLTTATEPLVRELVIALGAPSVLVADRASHGLVFACLGAAAAAVVVRAVGCGEFRPRTLLVTVAALTAGAIAGAVTSLAVTGLPLDTTTLGPHVLTELLVCTVSGSALLVLLADGLYLRPARRPRFVVVAGAVGAGLLAPAAVALSRTVVEGATAIVGENLALLFVNDVATIMLSLIGALVAVLCVARHAGALRTGLLSGVAAGALAATSMAVLRLAATPFVNDEEAWQYYLNAVWIGIGLATAAGGLASAMRREGSVLGVVAAATAVLVATAGLAVVQFAAGHPLDLQSISITLRIMGTIAMLTSLPLAALASVLRQFADDYNGLSSAVAADGGSRRFNS